MTAKTYLFERIPSPSSSSQKRVSCNQPTTALPCDFDFSELRNTTRVDRPCFHSLFPLSPRNKRKTKYTSFIKVPAMDPIQPLGDRSTNTRLQSSTANMSDTQDSKANAAVHSMEYHRKALQEKLKDGEQYVIRMRR